jgi:hypothetical protein
MIGVPLVLLLLVPSEDKPTPKLPLGKETTYITEPLDKDGYLDYESALNDRLGKGITPEKNASVLLWKALGPKPWGDESEVPDELFKRLGIDKPPEKGEYFIGLPPYLKDRAKLGPKEVDTIDGQQEWARQRPWAAEDYPHLAEWLKANGKPLAQVIEATRRPGYFNPLVTRKTEKGSPGLVDALIPSVQKCREFAVALAVRAMLRAGEGKPEAAWQDLLACHRLGRLVARGGTLTEFLVGCGIDKLANDADLAYLECAGLTSKKAMVCFNDLRGLPPVPSLADKFDLTERFTYLDGVQFARRYGLKPLALPGPKPPEKLDPTEQIVLPLIDWEPALRNANRLFDRTVAALRIEDRTKRERELDRVWHDVLDHRVAAAIEEVSQGEMLKALRAGKCLGKEVNQKVSDILIGLQFPSFRQVQTAAERTDQSQRNLWVAFALAAYRADHGRYPEKLGDLAPKYLAAVPDDLFSGKPLIYRLEGKGYLLYSVGVNGKDDGGRWTDDNPPGDDIRVSIPLPELKKN